MMTEFQYSHKRMLGYIEINFIRQGMNSTGGKKVHFKRKVNKKLDSVALNAFNYWVWLNNNNKKLI